MIRSLRSLIKYRSAPRGGTPRPAASSGASLMIRSLRSLIKLVLHQRARPADHVLQIRAGRHHRVHAVFLLDAEVDDRRAPLGARRRDGVRQLAALRDAQPEQAV